MQLESHLLLVVDSQGMPSMRSSARNIYITPGIKETLLISTVKFAEAGYITIFDQDQVNIHDQHNTVITVSRAAILRGWREPGTNDLWRIPLISDISNQNTNTVIITHPPSKYLPKQPCPMEVIFKVYKLRSQPELV
jgi:hypothetical protein